MRVEVLRRLRVIKQEGATAVKLEFDRGGVVELDGGDALILIDRGLAKQTTSAATEGKVIERYAQEEERLVAGFDPLDATSYVPRTDVGLGPHRVPRLDGNGHLPELDARNLINVPKPSSDSDHGVFAKEISENSRSVEELARSIARLKNEVANAPKGDMRLADYGPDGSGAVAFAREISGADKAPRHSAYGVDLDGILGFHPLPAAELVRITKTHTATLGIRGAVGLSSGAQHIKFDDVMLDTSGLATIAMDGFAVPAGVVGYATLAFNIAHSKDGSGNVSAAIETSKDGGKTWAPIGAAGGSDFYGQLSVASYVVAVEGGELFRAVSAAARERTLAANHRVTFSVTISQQIEAVINL